ncbi:MAG: hypothetical protein IJ029_00295 [Lachnospiraceae bacterium]|nr:hypothetical protein [Lachnospiraceae bacterium]MBQ8877143.1 hypothetical protein [Lachnospiraceae bacterium]
MKKRVLWCMKNDRWANLLIDNIRQKRYNHNTGIFESGTGFGFLKEK